MKCELYFKQNIKTSKITSEEKFLELNEEKWVAWIADSLLINR